MTGHSITGAGVVGSGSPDVKIATVTTDVEFAALEVPWNDVAAVAVPSSIFHRHEWYRAAWAWRQLDARLALLLATAGGRLVGILPLVQPVPGRGRARRLEP